MDQSRRGKGAKAGKKSELIALEDIVQALISSLDMPEDTQAKAEVFTVWEQVAGNAAQHSKAFRFRDSTLIVEVDSSIWINELSMRKSELMDRLQRAVGERVVKDIRFEVKKKRRE